MSSLGTWKCTYCTLDNEPEFLQCSACGEVKKQAPSRRLLRRKRPRQQPPELDIFGETETEVAPAGSALPLMAAFACSVWATIPKQAMLCGLGVLVHMGVSTAEHFVLLPRRVVREALNMSPLHPRDADRIARSGKRTREALEGWMERHWAVSGAEAVSGRDAAMVQLARTLEAPLGVVPPKQEVLAGIGKAPSLEHCVARVSANARRQSMDYPFAAPHEQGYGAAGAGASSPIDPPTQEETAPLPESFAGSDNDGDDGSGNPDGGIASLVEKGTTHDVWERHERVKGFHSFRKHFDTKSGVSAHVTESFRGPFTTPNMVAVVYIGDVKQDGSLWPVDPKGTLNKFDAMVVLGHTAGRSPGELVNVLALAQMPVPTLLLLTQSDGHPASIPGSALLRWGFEKAGESLPSSLCSWLFFTNTLAPFDSPISSVIDSSIEVMFAINIGIPTADVNILQGTDEGDEVFRPKMVAVEGEADARRFMTNQVDVCVHEYRDQASPLVFPIEVLSPYAISDRAKRVDVVLVPAPPVLIRPTQLWLERHARDCVLDKQGPVADADDACARLRAILSQADVSTTPCEGKPTLLCPGKWSDGEIAAVGMRLLEVMREVRGGEPWCRVLDPWAWIRQEDFSTNLRLSRAYHAARHIRRAEVVVAMLTKPDDAITPDNEDVVFLDQLRYTACAEEGVWAEKTWTPRTRFGGLQPGIEFCAVGAPMYNTGCRFVPPTDALDDQDREVDGSKI